MTKTKFNIKSTLETLKKEELQIFKLDGNFSNVKYKIFDRIFKATSPKKQKNVIFLENKLNKLETNTNYIKNLEYVGCRNKLDKIYEQKINGIRIRSECDWYKYREKSSKFFLNLEKS